MVSVRYTNLGQQCENTLYFDKETAWDETSMVALADSIASTLIADVMSFMPSTLILREIYVVSLESATAPAITYTGGLPQPGLSAEAPMPNNVTLTISFRTAGRGRSARGRNYLMGLVEPLVVGNTVDVGFTDRWEPFYLELLNDFPAEGFTWVVASRITGGAERAEGVTFPVVAFTYVDLTVDSQRRRLPGRGT